MKRSTLRTIQAAALTLCALTTASILLWKRNPAASAALSFTVNPSANPAKSTAATFGWKVGDTYTYALHSEVEMQSKEPSLAAGLPQGKIITDATYHVHVLRADSRTILLATQLSDVSMLTAGQHQTEIETLLSTHPCLLQLRPTGQVEFIRLPDSLSAEDRTYLIGLNQAQIILPDASTLTTWQTNETSNDFTFPCTYQATSAQHLVKHRKSPAATKNATCQILQSETHIDLGRDWITALSSVEKTVYFLQQTPVIEATSSYSLQRQPNSAALPPALAQLANGATTEGYTAKARTELSAATEAENDRQQLAQLKALYGNTPMSDVIDALKKAATADASHADTIPALHALRDWLLVHPEQALAVAQIAKDPTLGEAFTARLLHALELSATNPQSQAALATILQHPGDYPAHVLMQAVIASGGVGEIKSPGLANALAAVAAAPNPSDDYLVNDAALYALGNLSNTNPTLRDTLGKTLETQLTSTTNPIDPRDAAVALNTLANGRIATPALITQASTLAQSSPEEEVRAAALNYLGRTASADLNLLQHALHDTSDNVKIEAINVLTQPDIATPESIAATLALLKQPGTPESVTGHLIHSITPLQETFPAITPALQQARQSTPSANLLDQLNSALNL